MKRFFLPIAAALVTLVLCAVGIELMATAYLYATEGRYVAARSRFASKTNTFVQSLADGRECSYLDTLYPHPYLGFVHHGNPPCGIPTINNVGLFGPDFPSRRRDDRFVVLLTGGSVASQFASPVDGGPSYLEQLLNARYVSPTGKPFLVLDGADGAWKQPQQAIVSLLYVDAVNAIVTLDGFNEHYMISSGYRFEYPANNFLSVNPVASQNFADMVTRWMVGRLRSGAAGNAILSRSNAAYELVSAIERWAERKAASRPKPKTTIETMFALPPGWTPGERREWQIGQYRKYLGAVSMLAREFGVASAHFIQPIPAYGKTLTAAEQRAVGDLGYRDVYLAMTRDLLALNARGIPVVSMLEVFQGDSRTLYSDPIHLVRDDRGRSEGYEIMARQMAADLQRLWHLSER